MMKRGTVVCSITQGDRSAIQIEVAGRLVDGKGDVSFDREDVVVYRADADPAAHVVDCAQKIEDMLDEDVCRADREETSMMRMIHMRSDLFALTAQMRQGSTAPQEAARTEEVADFARSLMLDIDAGVGLALSDTQIMDNLRERLVATTSDPDAADPHMEAFERGRLQAAAVADYVRELGEVLEECLDLLRETYRGYEPRIVRVPAYSMFVCVPVNSNGHTITNYWHKQADPLAAARALRDALRGPEWYHTLVEALEAAADAKEAGDE